MDERPKKRHLSENEPSVPPIVADRFRKIEQLEGQAEHLAWLEKATKRKEQGGHEGKVHTLPEALYVSQVPPGEAERIFTSLAIHLSADEGTFVRNAMLAYHGWRRQNPYGIATPK